MEDDTMDDDRFYKVVAFDDNDVMEFRVLVGSNVGTIQEVHKFMDENIGKYPSCKWLLIPIIKQERVG